MTQNTPKKHDYCLLIKRVVLSERIINQEEREMYIHQTKDELRQLFEEAQLGMDPETGEKGGLP
ncbi:hypothetical protein IPH92_00840 [Candidatus Kaiserbacteria bacterium]|nr:MAG: hypothetical protein IPH92_00840 [Candidatus Kaiserbacteria bacterium]